MRRRSTAGGLAALVAMAASTVVSVGPSGAAPLPGNCVVSTADHAVDSVELHLANLVNNHRVANGRPRLALHQDLNRAAAWFSKSMADGNYFPPTHIDINGRDIPSRFTWCGVRYNAWAENIAAHTDGLASTIFNLWLNSTPHNTNMLSTTVRSMGIGRAFNAAAEFDHYFTNTFSDSFPIPPADFDDSGSTEIAVYRPSNGGWFIRNGSNASWGISGDIPVPADYDGDGDADIAVYRPSNGGWFINGVGNTSWGIANDIPVPGDYNGDGTTELAVYRPSNGGWFINGGSAVAWGISGDVPVPGDYDGDGDDEIAVYRPSNGGWFINGGTNVSWGISNDIPVPGDYNADGVTDIAVYRPSNGGWFVRNGVSVSYGIGGDIPVPGNYDGDGDTDIAVYRPSNGGWFVFGGSPAPAAWGIGGDIPLALPHRLRTFAGLPI